MLWKLKLTGSIPVHTVCLFFLTVKWLRFKESGFFLNLASIFKSSTGHFQYLIVRPSYAVSLIHKWKVIERCFGISFYWRSHTTKPSNRQLKQIVNHRKLFDWHRIATKIKSWKSCQLELEFESRRFTKRCAMFNVHAILR